MRRTRICSMLLLALLLGAGSLATGAAAHAATGGSAGASGATHAQVTVDPDAPKRTYAEGEDKPWTYLMAKALVPPMILLFFVIAGWYVIKVAKLRPQKA